MAHKRALGTNKLIEGWRRGRARAGRGVRPRAIQDCTLEEVEGWADEVIVLHRTKAIVSPVALEFLCGTTGQRELELSRASLGRFEVIDGGHVTDEDWEEARRFAQSVRDGRPRDLGDCLNLAITKRLGYVLLSDDQRMPRRN